ncbi:protein arginine kinase [Vallitalea okinawensis]|uniref:protein arginine kinase n=1 Tax=Vallitalea okinawensis TaxID=2078660 RepID=UPI000CFB0217|nr:protein arginine kinase [Vallitalea okinawensis]
MSNINKNDDVIITTRIRLARNIQKYPFPNRMSDISAEQMMDEIKEVIMGASSPISEHFEFYNLRELTMNEKLALLEERLISPELLKKQIPCGVILYRDLGLSVMINEEDHVRIQCITDGMNMPGAYELANRIDDLIEEKINYAYNEKYGYLTACPTNVGTGLRASYMLHVPALEAYGQLSIILQAIGKFGITVRGMYGEGTEAYGSIFQISNQITLGETEMNIIHNLNNITSQIIEQERRVRQKLIKEDQLEFEDKIFRSYGVLSHARKITAKEAMSLLSDVKVGLELGVLKMDKSGLDIYNLMTRIQPANLQKLAGRELNSNERDIKRAILIREKLPLLTNG